MKTRSKPTLLLAACAALLASSGAMRAQSAGSYTVFMDSNGNVVKLLAGTGHTLTAPVVASKLGVPTPAPVPAAPSGWSNASWGVGARDAAVAPNGTVYFSAATGTIFAAGSGGVAQVGGAYVVRVAVDTTGTPWCVTSGKAVFRLPGGSFVQVPGSAIDIAAGGDGSVWIVKPDFTLAKWNGSGWTDAAPGGGGARIAVDKTGNPWIANKLNQVFRWNGSAWEAKPGAVADLAIGLDGTIWALGLATGPGGYLVHHWDTTAQNWSADNVYGTVIAPGGGHVFVIRSAVSLLPTIMR